MCVGGGDISIHVSQWLCCVSKCMWATTTIIIHNAGPAAKGGVDLRMTMVGWYVLTCARSIKHTRRKKKELRSKKAGLKQNLSTKFKKDLETKQVNSE